MSQYVVKYYDEIKEEQKNIEFDVEKLNNIIIKSTKISLSEDYTGVTENDDRFAGFFDEAFSEIPLNTNNDDDDELDIENLKYGAEEACLSIFNYNHNARIGGYPNNSHCYEEDYNCLFSINKFLSTDKYPAKPNNKLFNVEKFYEINFIIKEDLKKCNFDNVKCILE